MSPEKPPTKRLPKSTRRQIRTLKNELRQELVDRQIPPQKEWEEMERLLSLRLPDYQQLVTSGHEIIRDWYEILLATRFLDLQSRKEANRSFIKRHGQEQIKEVSAALAVITQVLSK